MPGDPYWSDVVLLMGFEGANGSQGAPGMTDESPHMHGTGTVIGSAAIDTSQFKFGSSSGHNTGAGLSSIGFADSPDWKLSSANSDQYTVECWVRFTTLVANMVVIAEFTGGSDFAFTLQLHTTTSEIVFSTSPDGTFGSASAAVTSGAGLTTGVWYFVAADKDATGKIRIYVNGVMLGNITPANSSMFDSTAGLSVTSSGAGNSLNGWVDEVRITKGAARYASDAGFAVPTAAFPRGPVVTAPVVSNASFTLTLPAHAGEVIGVMTATNSPTSWSIIGGDPSGFYAVDNLGNISITPAGVAGIVAGPASLTVQATNAGGSGTGTASITVNPAVPVGPAIYAVVAPTQLPNGTVVTCGTTLTEGVNIPYGWPPPASVDPLNTPAVNAFRAEGVQFLAYGFNQSYCQIPITYWAGVPSAPGFYALTGLGAGLGAINMSSQTDIDQGGTFRQWSRVFMGPSVGWVAYPVQNLLPVTVAGTYVLDPSTNMVEVNVAGAVTIVLPSCRNPAVAAGAQAGLYVKNPVVITDVGGNAATNNITVTPNNVSETVMGLASIKIAANYGGYTLQPVPAQSTWTSISP